jgi:hypothetical protein
MILFIGLLGETINMFKHLLWNHGWIFNYLLPYGLPCIYLLLFIDSLRSLGSGCQLHEMYGNEVVLELGNGCHTE